MSDLSDHEALGGSGIDHGNVETAVIHLTESAADETRDEHEDDRGSPNNDGCGGGILAVDLGDPVRKTGVGENVDLIGHEGAQGSEYRDQQQHPKCRAHAVERAVVASHPAGSQTTEEKRDKDCAEGHQHPQR